MSIEKVIDKVRKLRALASSENLNEAKVAAAQAAALIEKHRLTEAMLHGGGEFVEAVVGRGRLVKWETALSFELAKHFGCVLLGGRTKWYRAQFVYGRRDDVAALMFLRAELLVTLSRLGAKEKRGKARTSFLLGAVVGIRDALAATKVAEGAVAAPGAAMVLAGREDAAKANLLKKVPNLKERREKSRARDEGAFQRGVFQGAQVGARPKQQLAGNAGTGGDGHAG